MQFFPEEKTFRNRRFVFQTFYFLLLVNGVIFFVIKSGFLRVLPISSTNKTDCHDIGEILLIVAFNTIAHTEIAVDKERQEQSLWMLVNMNVHPFRSRLKFM